VTKRSIDVALSPSELAARKTGWKLPEPRYRHGVLAKYARLVTGADQGAVTEP
jgi:dihydroxy-acid dehydratase